jgi:hypothetical protein
MTLIKKAAFYLEQSSVAGNGIKHWIPREWLGKDEIVPCQFQF